MLTIGFYALDFLDHKKTGSYWTFSFVTHILNLIMSWVPFYVDEYTSTTLFLASSFYANYNAVCDTGVICTDTL